MNWGNLGKSGGGGGKRGKAGRGQSGRSSSSYGGPAGGAGGSRDAAGLDAAWKEAALPKAGDELKCRHFKACAGCEFDRRFDETPIMVDSRCVRNVPCVCICSLTSRAYKTFVGVGVNLVAPSSLALRTYKAFVLLDEVGIIRLFPRAFAFPVRFRGMCEESKAADVGGGGGGGALTVILLCVEQKVSWEARG